MERTQQAMGKAWSYRVSLNDLEWPWQARPEEPSFFSGGFLCYIRTSWGTAIKCGMIPVTRDRMGVFIKGETPPPLSQGLGIAYLHYDCSLRVGSEIIRPSTSVRDLGVYLDAELTMKQHVSKVATACFYHLRRLRQIRRGVGTEVTRQLVRALITSRLDYWNSVSWRATVHSQRTAAVQNAAARLIFNLGPRDHVSDSLIELHWLPIHWRIQYKLNVLMDGIITGKCPDYLQTIVQPVTSSHPGLRSASCPLPKFVTPRQRTKFGERAFSYAGPAAWNSLPSDIRCTAETQTLKKLIKSYLFAKLLTLSYILTLHC